MKLEDELKMNFKNVHDKAMLNIIFTGNWIGERFSSFLKPYDLTEQQFNVLRILRGQKGKPANLFLIQERMLHKSSNTTRLVDKLKTKGFVERVVCEENRRKIEITITKKGMDLLAEIDEAVGDNHNVLKGKISKAEAETLAEILDRIRE